MESDRTVDGKRVVSERQVESTLSQAHGRAVYLTTAVELVLEDGSSVIACTECDFTTTTVSGAQRHAGKHKPDRRRPAGDWQAVTLGEAVAAAQLVERLYAERSDLLRRAKAAEADLAAIRRALRGVS